MPGRRFPRLEAIFGKPLSQLDAEAIRRAVDEGVAENDQLDWKQEHHERSVKGRTELAKDVCALANHQGGALIFGVADNDGVASKAMPVDVTDDQQRHVRSVLASNTAPMPRVDLLAVEESDRQGFLVVIVDPSRSTPHAVSASGSPSLLYPVRHGTQTRYLSEPEVAEAYGRRLEGITSRHERLGDLLRDGRYQLQRGSPWVVLALTPNSPGALELGYTRIRELREWLGRTEQPTLRGAGQPFHAFDTGAGLRRATIRQGVSEDSGRAVGSYLELHTDGSSFLAVQHPQGRDPAWPDDEWIVFDESLVEDATAMLEVACRHAIENAGTWGEATATFTILDPATLDVTVLGRRTALAHTRGFGRWEELGVRVSHLPWMAHTVVTDAALDGPGLLATVRLLATDLVQAFGVPELLQIDPEGRLRRDYFKSRWHDGLEQWASRNGADLVDERV